MKAAPNGSEFDPRRLSIEDLGDPQRVAEALTHWDELEPALLTAIETHPQHGPRLAMLRRADHWLETKGASLRSAMACPSSAELYDFGRGPGFGPLASSRRAELERHLRTCSDCEKLVETLAAPPPVPLELPGRGPMRMPARAGASADATEANGSRTDATAPRTDATAAQTQSTASRTDSSAAGTGATASRAESTEARTQSTGSLNGVHERPAHELIPHALPADLGSAQPFARTAPKSRLRALPRLAPLAVAASLIIGLGLWVTFGPSSSETVGFPQAQLLRGSAGGPLFFPRDRVLHATAEARAAFPALDGSVRFEIEPQTEASEYRVDLARHGGDAFAADEKPLLALSGTAPTITSTTELEAGSYTWTARATVRGLDQVLGSRDFAVADDAEVCKELAGLASRDEPGKSLAAVNLLHAHGYLAEARAIARAMAPSPERDAYLSQVPGR